MLLYISHWILYNANLLTRYKAMATQPLLNAAPSEDAPVPPVSANAAVTVSGRKAWAHLMEYPTLLEAHKAVENIKWLKPVKVSVGDSFESLSSVQPFKIVVDLGDALVDDSLVVLDGWVPSLKTVECRDITDSVTRPVKAAHFFIIKAAVEPAARSLNNGRVFLHTVENQTNDTVRGWTTGVCRSINLLIDTTCQFVLPDIDLEPTDEMSEMRKTKFMVRNIVTFKKKQPRETQPGVVAANAA